MFEGGIQIERLGLGKEGNVMAYHEEGCPKKNLVRKSINWAFAIILGLLVCIADIKLPAETRKSDTLFSHLTVVEEPFNIFEFSNLNEQPVTDPAAKPFVPSGEPELLPFDRIIHEAAGRHHVDADLILAVIMAESQLNPTARSKKGAKGLMQLMPVTADALNVSNIYCPEENVNAGVRHLRWLLDRFDGDLRMALAAYNAGVQNVIRHDGIPPFPETRAYVRRVLEYYAEIKSDTLEF
jgi:soluble lytic murein transglycosylase-like protein